MEVNATCAKWPLTCAKRFAHIKSHFYDALFIYIWAYKHFDNLPLFHLLLHVYIAFLNIVVA